MRTLSPRTQRAIVTVKPLSQILRGTRHKRHLVRAHPDQTNLHKARLHQVTSIGSIFHRLLQPIHQRRLAISAELETAHLQYTAHETDAMQRAKEVCELA